MTDYELAQHINTLQAGQDVRSLAAFARDLVSELRNRTSVGRELAEYINLKGICPAPRILCLRAPWLYEKGLCFPPAPVPGEGEEGRQR